MKIQGKTAWITGASSGIGKALAMELFQRGATLILSSRNASRLKELKESFDKQEPNRCHIVPCDVTLQTEISDAVAAIRLVVNRVDILVNNAGVSQRSYALDTAMEVDRQLLEVNFFGAVAITKAILPWMISQGGGHVVVISSMAGKFGFRMRSSYAASKHALHGFFETLRAEVHARNLKVTMICPGRISTDISIHSLTGDGSNYGVMDKGQARGIAVDKCARIIARSIERNRKEVFIGRMEVVLLAIKRLCPPLYYWIVNRASPT